MERLLTALGLNNKVTDAIVVTLHRWWNKLTLVSSMVYNVALSFQNAKAFFRKWNKFWRVKTA